MGPLPAWRWMVRVSPAEACLFVPLATCILVSALPCPALPCPALPGAQYLAWPPRGRCDMLVAPLAPGPYGTLLPTLQPPSACLPVLQAHGMTRAPGASRPSLWNADAAAQPPVARGSTLARPRQGATRCACCARCSCASPSCWRGPRGWARPASSLPLPRLWVSSLRARLVDAWGLEAPSGPLERLDHGCAALWRMGVSLLLGAFIVWQTAPMIPGCSAAVAWQSLGCHARLWLDWDATALRQSLYLSPGSSLL
jgi:hypothetical protein